MSVTRDYEVASAVYPDPRKLYERDEWYYESPYRPYRGGIIGGGSGFAAKVLWNWTQNRPIRSGLHIYVSYIVGGAAIGHFLQKAILGYYSYRDRVYRHYVHTHPEDFPPPPKLKVAEKWEPWNPVR